jgi:hypothetical protein
MVPRGPEAGSDLAPTAAGRRILAKLPEGTPRDLLAVEAAVDLYTASTPGDEPPPTTGGTNRRRLDQLRRMAGAALRLDRAAKAHRLASRRGRGETKAEAAALAVEALRAAWLALDRGAEDEVRRRWTEQTRESVPWEFVESALLLRDLGVLGPTAKAIAEAATPPTGRPGDDSATLFYFQLAKVWKIATGLRTVPAPGGDRRTSASAGTSVFGSFVAAVVAEIPAPCPAVSVRSLDAACNAANGKRRTVKQQQEPPEQTPQHNPRLRLSDALVATYRAGGTMKFSGLSRALGIENDSAAIRALEEAISRSDKAVLETSIAGEMRVRLLPRIAFR